MTSAKAKLDKLRQWMADTGIAGFLQPHEDEYQNEFLPAANERLAWLTGFTGSAGLAIVLRETAAIFVDGRYVLQVAAEVNAELWEIHNIADLKPEDWLAEHAAADDAIGYDSWLHTAAFRERFKTRLSKTGAALMPVVANPVDRLWTDRPAVPIEPAMVHPLEFAGEKSADKRRRIGELVADEGAVAAVIAAPDSLAWLLNIRGRDVPFTPLVLGRAILHTAGSVDLFVDTRKVPESVRQHLGPDVRIHAPGELMQHVTDLAASGPILTDPARTPVAIIDCVNAAGGKCIQAADPCGRPKAVKNDTELAGMRAAHRRDGLALTRFLAWLDARAGTGDLDEMRAAEHLLSLRAEGEGFQSLSFGTISAAGLNGAVVHYRVTDESKRRLEPGTLYLVDSGAQYRDGTTDVTRTIPIGEPTEEYRDSFTRVLKGHIALATCRFPNGTSGSQLDTLARRALWDAGLDYDHGTGHGVGSFLGVHEGPQRISKRGGDVALEPGMVLSNEPGYYRADTYGIRIESLVTVRADGKGADDREFYAFETLTLAPIDRRLIDPPLLSRAETAWLDEYHRRVYESLSPDLDEETRTWLQEMTSPL